MNQQDDINDMYSNVWFQNHMSNAVETTDHIVPKQYQDFLKLSQDNQKDWQVAMQEEIKSLRNRKVWDLVDLPEGCTAIKGRWVYTVQYDQEIISKPALLLKALHKYLE